MDKTTSDFFLDRRALFERFAVMTTAAVCAGLPTVAQASPELARIPAKVLIDDVERRTFSFFWKTVNRKNGLIPDRFPSRSSDVQTCNISSIGFAIVAYAVGAERGWITRSEATSIILTTLRFFDSLPMGESVSGCAGFKGFYYHYLDFDTGLRANTQTELSPIDVALLQLGFLFAAEWCDGKQEDEVEIRSRAFKLLDATEWDWLQSGSESGLLPMAWHPGSGFAAYGWSGYSEAKGMYLLAGGSKSHPLKSGTWDVWASTWALNWTGEGDQRHIGCAPLFTHQYSEMWIDFRGIQDATMRENRLDYFENSRRATYANRGYCSQNRHGWRAYSDKIWGLTACNGPTEAVKKYNGADVRFYTYAMRGPDTSIGGVDDGTIAPTGAISAIAIAPEIAVASLEELYSRFGGAIYGEYGFFQSFNPSFRFTDVTLKGGGYVWPSVGWIDDGYFSLEQGPIVGMIANYKSDFVWERMRRSSYLADCLKRAGFEGGWLSNV